MRSVEFQRRLAVIRTWFPLLVVSVLLAAGAAFVVSSLQPKVYEAKATLIVGQSLTGVNPDYSQLLASQRLSTTYAAVATTRPIIDAVIEQLGLNVDSVDLQARVRADAQADSTLLSIAAEDTDPATAAAIANAMADQLIAASPAIQGREAEFQASIDADLQATQDLIRASQAQVETLTALADRTAEQDLELRALEDRLASLRSTYASLLSFSSGNASNLLNVIEPAVAETSPVAPRTLLNVLLAAVLGLLVAVGIAFVADYLDDAIKESDDVRDVTGLSTLGTIARMKGSANRSQIYQLAALLYPRSGIAEAYRALRANIEFASVDSPVRTLLVTSSVAGEGKTVTAANLAVVFAQAGRRVLLVDADLRKPGVHQIFDLPNSHGLTTLLSGGEVSLGAICHKTDQANLQILTTGPLPPNPAELFSSQRMLAVLEGLTASGDLVIFDSPPLRAVTDAAVLSSQLDGTLFVIDSKRGHRGAVRQGCEILATAGANVLGAVINRVPVPTRSDDYASEYGEYYGTGSVPEGRIPVMEKSAESSAP